MIGFNLFSMRLVTLTLVVCVLIVGSGCGKSDEDSEMEYHYIRPGEMEIELEKMYQSYEAYAREERKMTDQNEINDIIQILIDKDRIESPYIFEKVNDTIQKRYLNYIDYKQYRASHPIDTTLAFYEWQTFSLDLSNQSDTASIDSALINLLLDSLR